MLEEQTSTKTETRPSHDMEVKVVATRNEDEGADFQITWEDDDGYWHNGPIVLPFDSGEYKIDFDLDDKSGLNMKFESTPGDAIWINADSCPVAGHGNDDKSQITDKRVASQTKLKLKNLNAGKACILHYRLRFNGDTWTNASGKTFGPSYSKDPEFRNGGSN